MKFSRKIIALIVWVVIAVNYFAFGTIPAFAHGAMLNVEYDDCIAAEKLDSIDEMWYALVKNSECRHISHNKDTITYRFINTVATDTEESNVSNELIQEIKNAYANSMKKWNNVCFYSYDSDGNIIKNKIINVQENENNYDITIYLVDNISDVASTEPSSNSDTIETLGTIRHNHYSKWIMYVNINHFYVNGEYDAEYVDLVRKRNGAHELAHVFGLRDVDSSNICNANSSTYHHEEVLMGYGSPMTDRASNITYKDIAGVAITRGFHTDSDHKWLNCGQQSDHNNNYKLLCSICNGVKYVSSLSGYTYSEYGSCNSNHHLGQGNMMAVASYGEADYYKCRYCKYVAPFSMIEYQDYSNASYYNATYHRYTNYVEGLEYKYLEEHNLDSDGYCTECDAHIEHEYGSYSYNTNSNHARTCACGYTQIQAHYIDRYSIVDGRYALCLGCNVLLDLENDYAQLQSLPGVKYSVNGSYLLPGGIAVLVDEDMEAYLNGTLQFYNENDLPVTQ